MCVHLWTCDFKIMPLFQLLSPRPVKPCLPGAVAAGRWPPAFRYLIRVLLIDLVLIGTQLQRSLRNLMFRFLVSLTKEGWNGIQRQSTVYTAVLKNEISVLRKDLHICVHCSIIHSSQDTETT